MVKWYTELFEIKFQIYIQYLFYGDEYWSTGILLRIIFPDVRYNWNQIIEEMYIHPSLKNCRYNRYPEAATETVFENICSFFPGATFL